MYPASLIILNFSYAQIGEVIWEENFDNLNNWLIETGNGSWGWGNGEHQYYTSRNENAFIEDGMLIIQALYERYNGFTYTIARIK